MRKSEKFLKRLKEDGERLTVPESLKPEWIEETLKEKDYRSGKRKAAKMLPDRRFRRAAAAAACICLLAAGGLALYQTGVLSPERDPKDAQSLAENVTDEAAREGGNEGSGAGVGEQNQEEDTLRFAKKSYEEIYEKLRRQGTVLENQNSDLAGDSMQSAPAASVEESEALADSSAKDFGQTTLRTEGVDEADTIKNDGRYLYQLAVREDASGKERQGIQIVDTKEGLQETAFVGAFTYPREFYVWEDLLIVLEDGYYTAEYVYGDGVEDTPLAVCTEDVLYASGQYTKIHIYDISDRENPGLVQTFMFDGAYRTSRLADGYLYGFTFFTPSPGEDAEDYETYIPKADGSLIPAEEIICPDEASCQGYLVMVSVDLSQPEELKSSRAALADEGLFYVSGENIYLASGHSAYEDGEVLYQETAEKEAQPQEDADGGDVKGEVVSDWTQILRFSYGNGRFFAKAEGRIPGSIPDGFCLDQSGEFLRAVTTSTEYIRRTVTDDRTGEVLGYEYESPEDSGWSNGLYILNEDLEIVGSLEGLAEGEQIYSARFLGDTAYFVTFFQTDPLFAVDVSEPEEPKVLDELKVSGFSEYLHLYGEGLLLGLGMEVDEDTGEQQGLKLSMFDMSDPAELSEKARLNLSEYDYSTALYDYKSLLIDVRKNLIGFEAQSYGHGAARQAYLVFSYEEGAFVEKLEIELPENDGFWYQSCRGTYIVDRFYLLLPDGSVQEYSLETGELVRELGV